MVRLARVGRTNRVRRATGAASGILVVAALLVMSGPASASSLARSARPADAYAFRTPVSAALVGADLFVANKKGNSVTEVNASTGAYVATISGPAFNFDSPTSIHAVGTDLYVTNGADNSVTEIAASSGAFVRTISGAQFEFSHPIAIAAKHHHLFVLSSGGVVTEVAATTGHFMQAASGTQFGFDAPTALAVAGNDLFVTNSKANTVTEIDIQTMTLVGILSGATYAFSEPAGIAFDGTNLWVTNETGGSVTEIAAATGLAVQVVVNGYLPTPAPITDGDGYLFTASPPGSSPMVTQITAKTASVNWMMCNTNGPYLFDNPQSLVVAGPDLWVINEGGNSLTEMDAATGALIGTFS